MKANNSNNISKALFSIWIFIFFFNISASAISIEDFFSDSIQKGSELEKSRMAQKRELDRLTKEYDIKARECCIKPDGRIDTAKPEYKQLLESYKESSKSIKWRYKDSDTRGNKWETEAKKFQLTKSGSDPKNIRADGDFVGDAKYVNDYRNYLRNELHHEVVDYGYKVVDKTRDSTIWRSEQDIAINAKEIDPDILNQMYEITNNTPSTATPKEVLEQIKLIDYDAFSTTGGKNSTGVKAEARDALGKVLDNEMKFRHAIKKGDFKTAGKSIDKMSTPELRKADPEFYRQAEILRNYGDTIEAAVIDIGDSTEIKQQKLKEWTTKAEAHIEENLKNSREMSKRTLDAREKLAQQIVKTDPEMAKRIRARNELVNKTNLQVEKMNKATQIEMIKEGKAPNLSEVQKYHEKLQSKIKNNIPIEKVLGKSSTPKSGKSIIRENGIPVEGISGINNALKILHGIGLIMVVHDISGRAEHIYQSKYLDRPQVTIDEVTSFGSGMTGASIIGAEWAWTGSLIGSAVCPGVGTLIGSTAGGIIGSIIGYTKGDSWGRKQSKWISSKLGVDQNVGDDKVLSATDTLYRSLIQKGLPEDKAKEAAKIFISGDLSKFKKYMANLRKKYVSSLTDVMKNEKMSSKEQKAFLNCMCHNKGGGMLGNHINDKGACIASGPLSSWTVPIGTKKSTVLKCVNQITRQRYDSDQAIFKEMHKLDEETYKKMLSIVEKANRKQVKKEIASIEKALRDKSDLIKASETFLSIKDYLSKRESSKLEVALSSSLSSAVNKYTHKGEMDKAVEASAWSYKVRGNDPEKEELHKKVVQWQKQWKIALSKRFPEIDKQINSGKIITAEGMMRQIDIDMLNGNRLPAASSAPEYKALKESLNKKKEEFILISNETEQKVSSFEKNKDPHAAALLLKKFLEEWQIEGTHRNDLNKRLKHDKYLFDKSIEYAKTADIHIQNKNYTKGIKFYKASLYNQKDPTIEKKLEDVLKIIASAQKLLKDVQNQQENARKKMAKGQAEWKMGMLAKAISTLKEAIEIDSSNKKIAKVTKAMQVQKKLIDASLKKADKFIEEKKFDQARSALKKAERISSKYPDYVKILTKLNVSVAKPKINIKTPILDDFSQAIAGSLHGLSWKMPCKEKDKKVCSTLVDKPMESTILGGSKDIIYDVNLQFKGIVELQSYVDGEKDHTWYTGGRSANGGWNIYKLEVSDPHQIYYLNAGKAGIRYCHKIDFVKSIKIRGGAKITLLADAQDGLLIGNIDNKGNPIIIPGVYNIAQPYNGQFIQMSVLSVVGISSATSNTSNNKDDTSDSVLGARIQAKYIGCYKDKGAIESTKGRDINGYYFTSSSMTIDKCTTSCTKRGFQYAGVQYAYGCFCGNTYGRDGKADNCDMPCTGDKNEICGGA